MSRLRDLIEYLEAIEQVVDKKYHDTIITNLYDYSVRNSPVYTLAECIVKEEVRNKLGISELHDFNPSEDNGEFEKLVTTKYIKIRKEIYKEWNK